MSTHTLSIKIVEKCDRCAAPIRSAGKAYAYGPTVWEHTGEPCTRTYGNSTERFPVTHPDPVRVCAADGGTLVSNDDAWSIGQRCTTCDATSRFSLGD